uniref:Uncharacterized protein n=1 Tax=Aliivibrio phage vB_Alvi_H905 TaxID=3234039 RepID=A0AB39C9P2_9VIRU
MLAVGAREIVLVEGKDIDIVYSQFNGRYLYERSERLKPIAFMAWVYPSF